MFKGASLRGIMVGSREMASSSTARSRPSDIHPVIDRIFPFEEAAEAYRYQASPDLFGKVVISGLIPGISAPQCVPAGQRLVLVGAVDDVLADGVGLRRRSSPAPRDHALARAARRR